LRALKSFEYLETLSTTYPLRDFAFTDDRVNLEKFLQNWRDEYLKVIEEKGSSPQTTIFPDSIDYARNYLLATNVNFFGNTLSPVNNTAFFFLNSAGASDLTHLIDTLIVKILSPYIKNSQGQFDQNRFDQVLKDLKEVFTRYMANSGGQLAQIFIKKNVVNDTAFLAWNGGVPVWLSKDDNELIFQTNTQGRVLPVLVFWPNTQEQIDTFIRPGLVEIMNLFVGEPASLASTFSPIVRNILYKESRKLLEEPSISAAKQFIARDSLQARILPKPEYFTNQNITGVKMYTLNKIEPSEEKIYYDEIFQIIRNVIGDFLANATSEKDFKEGDYLLKKAFIATQKGEEEISTSNE